MISRQADGRAQGDRYNHETVDEMSRLMDNRRTNRRWRLPAFLLTGIAALVVQEVFWRHSLIKAIEWSTENPQLALTNLLLIYSFMAAVIALAGKTIPGLFVSSLVLGTSYWINTVKVTHLHQPLFAWDLLYYQHIYVLLPQMPIKHFYAWAAAVLLPAAFVLVFILFRRENRIRPMYRISMLCAAFLVLASFVYHRELPGDLPSVLSTENAIWDQRSNYAKNGFLLALVLNVQPILIDEPDDYSEETIRALTAEIHRGVDPVPRSVPAEPVNLILFVSESFYDLIHVNYRSDEDPLWNFKSYLSRFPTFRMASPVFGGNTSNAEFEILTGLTNAFLPAGAVPYDHYIKRETPSIPLILRDNGYRTVAVHPYHAWFWNRHQVFPLLGFEQFISAADFSEDTKRGWFISDEALVDRVIRTVEKTGGPYFIFALSMQNHGVYDAGRYAPDEVMVSGEFPERLRLSLQTYVTGLRDADRQLARLIRYLETRSEPVILLFTGDHLPGFGKEFALYRESGIIRSRPGDYTREEYFYTSSVPCLLWSNRPELLASTRSLPDHISPIYFAPLLLERMGIQAPPHYLYLSRGLQDYPVLHRRFMRKAGGELVDFSIDEHPFLKGLELLQYDILLGERYSLKHGPTGPDSPMPFVRKPGLLSSLGSRFRGLFRFS